MVKGLLFFKRESLPSYSPAACLPQHTGLMLLKKKKTKKEHGWDLYFPPESAHCNVYSLS